MTTPRFNRGLSDDFVKALNDEYRKGGWWRNLVDDPKTFLAIRDDYVNIYYRGCALLMLRLNGNRLHGLIHYKYLLRPSAPDGIPEYVTALDGKPDLDSIAVCFSWTTLPMLTTSSAQLNLMPEKRRKASMKSSSAIQTCWMLRSQLATAERLFV